MLLTEYISKIKEFLETNGHKSCDLILNTYMDENNNICVCSKETGNKMSFSIGKKEIKNE